MVDFTGIHLQEEVNAIHHRLPFSSFSTSIDFCNDNMQEIIPGVFLGPYSVAQLHCFTKLLEKGIRYIICVRHDKEANYIRPQINDPNFKYLTLDIADHETENILRYFPVVNEFIDEALSKNLKVLVHGNSGNSRSATLVSAYIMEKFGKSVSDALGLVKIKRATVNPNEGFKAQLLEYEPIYKARQNVCNNGCSSTTRSKPKRKSHVLIENPDSDTCDYNLTPPPPSPVPCDEDNTISEALVVNEFSNHLYRLWLAKR